MRWSRHIILENKCCFFISVNLDSEVVMLVFDLWVQGNYCCGLYKSSLTSVVISVNPVWPVWIQCNQCCGLCCVSLCLRVGGCDPPAAQHVEFSRDRGFKNLPVSPESAVWSDPCLPAGGSRQNQNRGLDGPAVPHRGGQGGHWGDPENDELQPAG